MEYGEKIVALRKSNGMTQAELGAALNVTFQAVSKWERGESYPDFKTLSKIARLFGVSISYFEDGDYGYTQDYAPAAEVSASPSLLGVCTVCGRGIYDGAEIAEASPLVCTDCHNRKIEMEKRAKRKAYEDAQAKKRYETLTAKRKRNKGLIAAGITCAILLVLVIIGAIMYSDDVGATLLGYVILAVFLFPFIAQLFWGGFIVDVVLCGVKVIGTPGVIFTFDLDGFIFLIGIKLLFAVLKIVILLLCMAFFAVVGLILSPFTFIPACVRLSRGKLPD